MERLKQQKANQTRHAFLLTLFPQETEGYQELPMNGFILIKRWNGSTNRWEVAIYTKESYAAAKQYHETFLSLTQPSDTATSVSST